MKMFNVKVNNNEDKNSKTILVKKIQIYPSKEQINQLEHDSLYCKILYNTYLTQRKELYQSNKQTINLSQQRSQIPMLREQNSEYSQIYAKHLHAVCEDLEQDYKGVVAKRSKGEKAKYPKYKDKNYWFPLKTPKQYIKLKNNKIKLGFYEFNINMNEIPETYGEIWITKIRNKYILSITYEARIKNNDLNNILAIDLGISKLITAINQDGNVLEIINPRFDKYWNKKIDKVRSMRDKKKRGSKRRKKLNKTLNKLYEKRRRQQQHFLHSVTKRLVQENKVVIIGNLSQEQMIKKSKSKKLNRSIKENWGLGKFKVYLTYKAKLHDVNIIKINEAYTSKTCSNCGTMHDMPLNNRIYKCDCGMETDRDINSSINIYNRFIGYDELNYKKINEVTTLYFRNGKLVA